MAEPDLDQVFAVNRTSYLRDFEHVYSSAFSPRTLIQFPVILPFHVPLRDGACVTFVYREPLAHTYHFSTVKTIERVDPGIIGEKPLSVPVSRSRVEMVRVFGEDIELVGESSPTDHFDALLEGLNLVLTAYLIFKKDEDVHRVSKDMLQFSSLFRVIGLPSWTEKFNGLFVLHMDVPYLRDTLNENDEQRVIEYANILRQGWNPFVQSEEIALTAKRYLKDGFYSEAVVYAQIAVETFLSVLFTELLIEEGKPESDAQKAREALAFIPMVRSEFHPRLGDNWNLDLSGNEIGRWHHGTYELRNRVLHSGYFPSLSEASQGLSAALQFRQYIVSLIRRKSRSYTRLNAFFEVEAHSSKETST